MPPSSTMSQSARSQRNRTKDSDQIEVYTQILGCPKLTPSELPVCPDLTVVFTNSKLSKKDKRRLYDKEVRKLVGWRCAICSGILLASNADAIIFGEDSTPPLIPIHSGKCAQEALSFLERDKRGTPRTDEPSGKDELTTDDNVRLTPGRLELRQDGKLGATSESRRLFLCDSCERIFRIEHPNLSRSFLSFPLNSPIGQKAVREAVNAGELAWCVCFRCHRHPTSYLQLQGVEYNARVILPSSL